MTFAEFVAFVATFARHEAGNFIDPAFGREGKPHLHWTVGSDGKIVRTLHHGCFGASIYNGVRYVFETDRPKGPFKCASLRPDGTIAQVWNDSGNKVAQAIKGSNESAPRMFGLPWQGLGTGRGGARGGAGYAKGNANDNVRTPGSIFEEWANMAQAAARDLREAKSNDANAMFAKVDALQALFGADDPNVMALRKRATDAINAIDSEVASALADAIADAVDFDNATDNA